MKPRLLRLKHVLLTHQVTFVPHLTKHVYGAGDAAKSRQLNQTLTAPLLRRNTRSTARVRRLVEINVHVVVGRAVIAIDGRRRVGVGRGGVGTRRPDTAGGDRGSRGHDRGGGGTAVGWRVPRLQLKS